MKIGIPQALINYYIGEFWENFFLQLDITVIKSRPTDRHCLEEGIRKMPGETCLP
ncbi:MAG: hypothetical protein JW915_23150 [Chitinispirillaceae bacterium]|nr:hypothetical protein [Chitinispirillaceae bacterium]